jgi:hypothetical protein
MDKAHQETCVDTGLALGLSVSGASIPAAKNNSVPKPNSNEPSLTLSIPEIMHTNLPKLELEISKHSTFTGTTFVPSPPHSAVTAFSAGYIHGMVKRERETAGEALSNNSNSRASEEDDDGGTRKKLRLTKEQSALLEDRFKEHTTLNPKQKQVLAKQLNLRPRQVEVWFQNRRARFEFNLKLIMIFHVFYQTIIQVLTTFFNFKLFHPLYMFFCHIIHYQHIKISTSIYILICYFIFVQTQNKAETN